MDVLRWDQGDAILSEKAFHEELHLSRAEEDAKILHALQHPRLKTLQLLEEHHPRALTGRVMDAGAGTGYLAATLSKYSAIEEVYCLEITEAATERLIPRCLELSQAVTSKIKIVQGTYDYIPLTDHFDTVFCFGSLHHSTNLLSSLGSLYAAIKPGGMLVADEPATDDFTSNAAFIADRARTALPDGSQRHDHFFRKAEWLVAAHHSGFDVLAFEPAVRPVKKANGRQGWRAVVSNLRHRWRQIQTAPAPTNGLRPVPHLLLLQKPLEDPGPAPHRWTGP